MGIVDSVVEPDGEMGLEFGGGGGEDAGDKVVGAGVGAAEAEDAAEVGKAHDKAATVAPGAEEPVEADGVFVADGEGALVGEGGVAVIGEQQAPCEVFREEEFYGTCIRREGIAGE